MSICIGLFFHGVYAKNNFKNSNYLDVAKLTTLPHLAFGANIYDHRFNFDSPNMAHPLMPTISYRGFVYE